MMRKNRRLFVVALPLLFLFLLMPNANADVVVFDNGGPNQHNGNEMTDFLQSEDFTLTTQTQITDVHFWDLQAIAADYLGSIYWAIQGNAAGMPGTILASGTTSAVTHTATGLTDDSGLFTEFLNGFNITPTILNSGTYWLTLHDGPLSNSNFADFYWEWSSDIGNGQEFDLIANNAWDSNLAEHAFQLTGTPVPEPTSIVLLATILGGLSVLKLRSSHTRPPDRL
jgi:hypothetical protein